MISIFLLGFLAGVAFTLIYPMAEEAVRLYLTWIEVPKGKLTLKITKTNQKIQDIVDPIPPKNPIGFYMEDVEDQEEYNEEENDDEEWFD